MQIATRWPDFHSVRRTCCGGRSPKRTGKFSTRSGPHFVAGERAERILGGSGQPGLRHDCPLCRLRVSPGARHRLRVLAYQTAYLKANYPLQFMAAMLTASWEITAKLPNMSDECRQMGIEVLPPDINESGKYFTPIAAADGKQGAIRFGLAAVKNVGTQAIEAILRERERKPFESLLDFCRRVDLAIATAKW